MSRRMRVSLLLDDQAGQTTVEFTLLLAVFGLPIIAMCNQLLAILCKQYEMTTFLQLLPLP